MGSPHSTASHPEFPRPRSAGSYTGITVVKFHGHIARPDRCYLHSHPCRVNVHSFQMHAGNMIFVLDAHRYRSIDAGTGIPAAVRLQRLVHRNAQQILSRLNGIGNVHVKGGITVVVRADRKAVEIDSAILIDAFKMQDDGFPDRRFFQNKSLLILIFSAGEISGIDPFRQILSRASASMASCGRSVSTGIPSSLQKNHPLFKSMVMDFVLSLSNSTQKSRDNSGSLYSYYTNCPLLCIA